MGDCRYFYYVSVLLNGTDMDCNEGWLPATVLLATIIVIMCHFRHVYHGYISYEVRAQQAAGRHNTMVSVINKLTRFIPPQIWEPIVERIALSVSPINAQS